MLSEQQKTKRRHPGKGVDKGRNFNRGRQLDGKAVEQIGALLGDRSRQRDMLLEHLHLIQDKYGHISAAHLAALAAEMKVPMAEAYEVATFYAHFDLVKEGESAPPEITVRVCGSLSCELRGAEQLQNALQQNLDPQQVRVVRAPCMGRCDTAPVAEIGHRHIDSASVDNIQQAIADRNFTPEIPRYENYQEYSNAGGYAIYRKCFAGEFSFEEILQKVKGSGLRGLGGAGFPTGSKWEFVRKEPQPRLMAVNADEGEPGTFKDRYYLERNPHCFLEGMLISAWAVEAKAIYIYLRDEYPVVREILLREIEVLQSEGLIGSDYVHLRRGAGSYVCGEESAMIESIEGKRGYPRQRPPYVAQVGLFDRPTLVNNVETLFWLQRVLEKGPQILSEEGRNGRTGLRSFSVSGRVTSPGVKLAPAGITMRELLDEYCGGMQPGHSFKAYLPGGPSGGILPASMADIPLDFGTLEEYGCLIGSAAVVVLSDQDDMRQVVLNLLRFFEDESCGQCTPCRVGTEKTVALLEQDEWDVKLLDQLRQVMCDASICGLGQAASNPVTTAIKYFSEEVLTVREVD